MRDNINARPSAAKPPLFSASAGQARRQVWIPRTSRYPVRMPRRGYRRFSLRVIRLAHFSKDPENRSSGRATSGDCTRPRVRQTAPSRSAKSTRLCEEREARARALPEKQNLQLRFSEGLELGTSVFSKAWKLSRLPFPMLGKTSGFGFQSLEKRRRCGIVDAWMNLKIWRAAGGGWRRTSV